MAKRHQKFKKHSLELKTKILEEHEKGFGWRSLARMHPEISENTIHVWITKHNKDIDITIDRRKVCSGRKRTKNLTINDYKERYEILKKYQAFLEVRQGKK